MMLIGNNLGERHQDLNSKVSEAVAKQTNFEELKSQPEKCDVDKLIKIDLASKYKNIDYILEVLKCGDIFYITRALKCLWLYTDEYSQFINPSYLDANIFPCMSMKMKRKMLTTISIHMRNADRAVEFYEYCIDARLNNNAVKFLIFTPDSFKIHLLKSRTNISDFKNSKYLKQFINNSFVLALAYLELRDYSSNIIYELRFLYFLSKDKYLNILEEHIQSEVRYPYCLQRVGIRISEDILIKHKQRVMNNPNLYVNILNKAMLVKYLTIEDVESLGLALLPRSSNDFWSLDFYNNYKFLFQKIPSTQLYAYIKQIYITKYNGCQFDMSIEFYKLKYYEMLNLEEREAWALQHIERDREIPGIKNYMWYKFVSFPKAFFGIKRYIFLTPNRYERSKIINILPKTARNQNDINEILSYYYERHVNESEEYRESFVDKIIELHDIYSFNDECWTSLDKLFYSLDVYRIGCYARGEYKFRSLIYHILHNKESPEALHEYIDKILNYYHLESIIEELSEERKTIVAKYLISYYTKKIFVLMDHPDYDDTPKKDSNHWESGSVNDQINDLIIYIWNIINTFKRPHDYCPDIVVQYMEINMSYYQYFEKYRTKFVKRTEGDFVRWLKQDIQMAIDGISEIRCNTYRWNFRLSRLFQKLKVYFPNDVGKKYLNYFIDYLSDVPCGRREYRNIKMAVVGVYYLAEPVFIKCFLEKNFPTGPDIDHMNIDKRVLQVQKAICRLAYHPRPPLPLSIIQKYITRDYVHYCIPTFGNYFANLPSNVKFIESLLDAPLSIQKHGLRLAIKVYDAETLKLIIKSAWKKTKNVSLRMVLYRTLFDRILNESKEVQKELYEVLKLYTSELNHDDHDSVYSLLVSTYFPDLFKGDFIETAWLTVSRLSNKSIDIKRRISVICHMDKNIHFVQRDFPRFEIIDNHVNDMLHQKNINNECGEHFQQLIKAKWDLTAKYIVSFNNEIEKQKSLELLEKILSECQECWNLINKNTYTVRKFLQNFIKTIMIKDPKTIHSCENIVSIYKCILDNIESFLKKEEMYLINLELKLSITCRNIIHKRSKMDNIRADEARNTTSKEIAKAYGKEVANIIKSYVKNDEFYRCFYQSIADIVDNIGCTICDIVGIRYSDYIYYFCNSLIEFKMTETHLLAIFILPRDALTDLDAVHRETITNIQQQLMSREVRSYLYEKYVLSDYQVRRYVM